MKRLLLTSDGLSNKKLLDVAKKLLVKPASESKALIIYTLRKKSYIKYVRKVKKQLLKLGIKKTNISYANISNNIKKPKEAFDIIYSCGGNTFYILDRLRKTGFDGVIKSFVNKGGFYIGVSAGSMIVHKTINCADSGKDGDVNYISLKNLNALNLTNIWIWPHFRNALHKEVVAFRKSVKFPVKELRDGEALLIHGNKSRKI